MITAITRWMVWAVLLMWLPVASAGQAIFWQATGGDKTVSLMGSLHFGEPDMYPLDRQIMDAFEKSSVLAVEADLTSIDTLAFTALVLEKGMLNNQTLADLLAPDTWQQLIKTAKTLGLPKMAFERQKPWLASLSLASVALIRSGYSEDLGIDRFFAEQANEGRKPVHEFESIEWQLGMFDSFSLDEQIQFLKQTLDDLGESEFYFRKLFAAWKRGDAFAVNELVNETISENPQLELFYQRVLVERNRNMAAQIDSLLAQGERPFVVVGAGHMVGEHGLVALFRERGFEVKQLGANR